MTRDNEMQSVVEAIVEHQMAEFGEWHEQAGTEPWTEEELDRLRHGLQLGAEQTAERLRREGIRNLDDLQRRYGSVANACSYQFLLEHAYRPQVRPGRRPRRGGANKARRRRAHELALAALRQMIAAGVRAGAPVLELIARPQTRLQLQLLLARAGRDAWRRAILAALRARRGKSAPPPRPPIRVIPKQQQNAPNLTA